MAFRHRSRWHAVNGLRPRQPAPWIGLFLAILGAIGFASKGIFAKALYADGWSVETVVLLRALYALPFMVLWIVTTQGIATLAPRNLTAIGWTALAGIACYYAGATFDFQALQLIDASVERVLLFSYPSIVVLIDATLYRRRPPGSMLVALVITYAGIFFVVTGFDLKLFHSNLTGAGLVLACALTSAVYYVTGDRWSRAIGSSAYTVYALAAATLCLAAQHWTQGHRWQTHWTVRDVALFAGLVCLATVVPMLAMAEGVRRLGAPRASVVSTVGPPTTILLGAWVFGERFSPAQWLGVALIVAGILVLEALRRPSTRPRANPLETKAG
jgi:drug/metabolite transporter (DMT)-like permease